MCIRVPLIVEVNGTFGNPENYLGLAPPWKRYLKRTLGKFVGRFVLSAADGVRLLFREQLDRFAPWPCNAQVGVFHDLVPTARFANLSEDDTILFVGFPFHLKGVDVLLTAFERVKDEFPRWTLTLIGHDLERHVRVYAKCPRIRVFRGMPNTELARHIGRAGIFVLPSRSEGLPRVLIEAAAAGKPRIAARVGGTYVAIRHGLDGLLFEKDNVDELAGYLRTLMASPDYRHRLGNAAFSRAQDDLSESAYLREFGSLVLRVFDARVQAG